MPQTVKFVDRPGGTTLLDVTPGVGTGVTVGEGGVQCPPPPIRRTIDANPIADGSVVTAAAYDLRAVVLPLVYTTGVQASTAAQDTARRAAVRALMRVLTRERFWLELRADGATESRFLYCYRTMDDDLIARLDGLGDRWVETVVEIPADPFAYGPKETLSKITLNIANDFRTTIAGSGVKGDVPAPLICQFDSPDDTGSLASAPRTYWLASRIGSHPVQTLIQFSALTNGTAPAGSTFTANDAVAAIQSIDGTADKWAAVAVGQEILAGEGNIIQTAGGANADIDGTYRVFVVIPNTLGNGGEQFTYGLRLVTPSSVSGAQPEVKVGQVVNDTYTGLVDGWQTVFDLGVVDVPYGGRPTAVGFDAEVLTKPASMRFYAKKVAGAAASTRWFDAFFVLPADATMLCVQLAGVGSGVAASFIVDPHQRAMIVRDFNSPFPAFANAPKSGYQGQTPYVVPGTDVVVAGFAHSGGVGLYSPSVTAGASNSNAQWTVAFTPSYWPAYLTVV